MPYSTRGLGLGGYGTAPNQTFTTPYTGNPMAAGSFPNPNTAFSPSQFGAYAKSLGYTPFPTTTQSQTQAPASSPGSPKSPTPSTQMPSWWSNLGNTSSGYYQPPRPNDVNYYTNLLQAGWNVNPNTGMAVSPAQAYGKAGGSLQDYIAHHGILDPVSAQSAIQQFQQNLSSGELIPGLLGTYETQEQANRTSTWDPAWSAWWTQNQYNPNPSVQDLQGLVGQLMTQTPGQSLGYQNALGKFEGALSDYVKVQQATPVNAAAAAAPPSTPQQIYQSKQPGFSGFYFGGPSQSVPQSALDYGQSQMSQGKAWDPHTGQWVQGVWNPVLKNYELPKP